MLFSTRWVNDQLDVGPWKTDDGQIHAIKLLLEYAYTRCAFACPRDIRSWMEILEDSGRGARLGRLLQCHPHFHFELHEERVLAAISNKRPVGYWILLLTGILVDLGFPSFD